MYSSYVNSTSSYINQISSGNTPGAPSPAEVDRALGVFVEVCGTKYGVDKCKAAIYAVKLEWSGVVAPSPSTGVLTTVVVYGGVLYAGLNVGNFVMVAWRGKISRSALVHELCHVVGANILGDPNPNHTNVALAQLEQDTNIRLGTLGL